MREVLEKLKEFAEEKPHDSRILLNYYEVVLILEYINKLRDNEMFNYDMIDKILNKL